MMIVIICWNVNANVTINNMLQTCNSSSRHIDIGSEGSKSQDLQTLEFGDCFDRKQHQFEVRTTRDDKTKYVFTNESDCERLKYMYIA